MIFELQCYRTGRRFLITPTKADVLEDDYVGADRFYPTHSDSLAGWMHADCTDAVRLGGSVTLFEAPEPFVLHWGSVGSLVPRPDADLPEAHRIKSYDDEDVFLSPEELERAIAAAREIHPGLEPSDD